MAADLTRDLTTLLRGAAYGVRQQAADGRGPQPVGLAYGAVTGTSPLEVDGMPMTRLASYTTPALGDQVAYLTAGAGPGLILGEVA